MINEHSLSFNHTLVCFLFLLHKGMLFNFNPLVCIWGLIGHWLVPGMLPMPTKTLNFTQIAKPKSAFGQKKKQCDSHLYKCNNTILLNLWNIIDISPPYLLSWWFNKAKFALPRKKSTNAQLLFLFFSIHIHIFSWQFTICSINASETSSQQ